MCIALVLVDRRGQRQILLACIAIVRTADVVLTAMFLQGFSGARPLLKFGCVLLFNTGFSFGFGSRG